MTAGSSATAKRRELVVRLIAERAVTGETWRSIAARTGMAYPTLTGWAWRLRREQAQAQSADGSRSVADEFVELIATDSTADSCMFEVVLRCARRVRVDARFDEAALARLVRAVEAC